MSGRVFVDIEIEKCMKKRQEIYIKQGKKEKAVFHITPQILSVSGCKVTAFINDAAKGITKNKNTVQIPLRLRVKAFVRGGGLGGNWGIHLFDADKKTVNVY